MSIPKSYRLPLIIIFIELVGVIFLIKAGFDSQDLLKPQSENASILQDIPLLKQFIDHKSEDINGILQANFAQKKGKYSVVIADIKHNKKYVYGENAFIGSASIYKLAILYKAFEEIERGTLKKDEILSGKKSELDAMLGDEEEVNSSDISIDPADDEEISYTVDLAMRLMIRISDNYAALLLAEKLGWAKTQMSLEDAGIEGFDLISPDAPRVSANATAKLLEKIYKKEAVSKVASEEMMQILLEQQINDRIPKYLSKDIKVAHKTGDLEKIRHDAGIIFGKKGDYIFVFLTESDQPVETSDLIASVSKSVFDILEN